jgi:tetratricopeptide (TPR) repeat protein
MAFLRALTGLAVAAVAAAACHAQSPESPQPQNPPIKTQPSPTVHSPLPPSPPDAPIPDQGVILVRDDSGSAVKRALRRLDPNCLDAIIHLCWSFPPASYSAYDKGRVAEDIDLGNSYLKRKNYRGAEFRFEDALSIEPDNVEATFRLAESLARLDHGDEAQRQYEAYLKIAPNGIYAAQARKALAQLAKRAGR